MTLKLFLAVISSVLVSSLSFAEEKAPPKPKPQPVGLMKKDAEVKQKVIDNMRASTVPKPRGPANSSGGASRSR